MAKSEKIVVGILFGVFFVLYWVKGSFFLDSDFGWHLRLGQLILQKGIPATDPLSYTMPTYPFVDHEWLSNMLLALSFPYIGQIGLAFLFAFLALIALFFSFITIPVSFRSFALAPLFLAGMGLLNAVGVRTQVTTWVLFSLFLFILRSPQRYIRWRFILPVLIVLWANLHGGFAIGIVAVLLAVGVRALQLKKLIGTDILLVVLCLAASFATPYHFHLWWEVWMQMSDGNLRWNIQEWMPAFFLPRLTLWAMILLSAFFVWRERRKLPLFDVLLYSGLLVAALGSVRHVPLWLLVAFPLTVHSLGIFFQEVAKIPFARARLRKALLGYLFLCIVLGLFDQRGFFVSLATSPESYPAKAVAFLEKNPPKGEIFSTYNWGGYLIWKLSSKKVFIDGRMPSWRREPVAGESSYAFLDYKAILSGKKSYTEVALQYNIQTVLLPYSEPENRPSVSSRLDQFANRMFHYPLPEKEPFAKFKTILEREGWKIIYKDKTAVIYQEELPK